MPIAAELLWIPNNIGVAILIIVILYGEWLYPYSNYLPSAGISLSDLCLSIGFISSGISIFAIKKSRDFYLHPVREMNQLAASF